WTLFYLWDGGMSSHGGILGVTIFVFIYCWRKGYNPMSLGDNVVSLAGLGIFFVRMANFINGELWGKPWNGKWAVQFPSEMKDFGEVSRRVYAKLSDSKTTIDQLIVKARTDEQIQQVFREELTPRHPSQIYQGLMEGLLLFVVLMVLRLRFKNMPWGLLTGIFFISYATLRIMGEVFRYPDSGNIGALSKGQFFSIFMYVLGIGFVVYALKWGREGARKLAQKRGK
ncbi:MAG: prolipoprotein diacylglyceryl transferase, partial [Verrucomicrobiota bacterium]